MFNRRSISEVSGSKPNSLIFLSSTLSSEVLPLDTGLHLVKYRIYYFRQGDPWGKSLLGKGYVWYYLHFYGIFVKYFLHELWYLYSATQMSVALSFDSKKSSSEIRDVVVFKPSKGETAYEVIIDEHSETVWETELQIADIFNRVRTVINRHIKNCFKKRELDETSTSAKIAQV